MRRVNILFMFVFLFVILSSFVSAQSFNFGSIERGFTDGISFLFGDVTDVGSASSGEVLFVKLLIFILLFVVIYSVIGRIPRLGDNRPVQLVVSLVVAIISVRYMTTSSLINFIWLPYGVLGVAFSVFVPFVIGFFFIEGFESSILRKTGWILYLVIFAGLAYLRWPDFATTTVSGSSFNLGLLYVIAAILALLLFLFDKRIRTAMHLSSLKGASNRKKRISASRITREIEDLREDLSRTDDPKARSDIRAEIEAKYKALDDLMKS